MQFADIGAGAFFQALERNRPDDCNPEFAEILKPIVAKSEYGNALGFGFKTMPSPSDMGLSDEQKAVFEAYGYAQDKW